MKKKLCLFVALAIMLTLLVACGGNESADAGTTGMTDTTDTTGTTEPSVPSLRYEIKRIDQFYDGLARFLAYVETEDGYGTEKYGYMDMKGNVVVEPIYKDAQHFHEGRARVYGLTGEDDYSCHYGYIDTTGKLVTELTYWSADEQFNTLALVSDAQGKHYIDREGNVVYTETEDVIGIGAFSNGLFWVQTEEVRVSGNVFTLTYYNEKGEVAFTLENAKSVSQSDPLYANSNFNDFGYACVEVREEESENWNSYYTNIVLVDKDGIIQTWAEIGNQDSITSLNGQYGFIGGHSWDNSGYYFYINYANQTITQTDSISYRNVQYINTKYFICECDLYKNNKKVVDDADIPEFEGAWVLRLEPFMVNDEIYIWVQLKNSDQVYFAALIDTKGNVVIEPTASYSSFYEYKVDYRTKYAAHTFAAGVCKVYDQKTHKIGFVDMNGKWVIEPQFSSATDFYGEGEDAVAVVNGQTIINRKGEVVFTISN